jgi:hypothetical protein
MGFEFQSAWTEFGRDFRIIYLNGAPVSAAVTAASTCCGTMAKRIALSGPDGAAAMLPLLRHLSLFAVGPPDESTT